MGHAPTVSFEKESAGAIFERLSAATDLPHLLFDVGRDMSICGIGYVLVWLEQSGMRACRVDPLSCFTLRKDTAGGEILGCVRLYGAMDDMQSVANAFLALYGLLGTTEDDIRHANRTRILSLSEGGRAEFVTKNLNHEALCQLEGNLRRSILQLSMTPDLSDESFSGNASGVALQYKLWGIEQVRSAKEHSFTAALRALLKAFAGGLSTLGTAVDFTGEPVFYKNLPRNDADLAQTMLSLSDILSKRTILEHLPWVRDVEEEVRRKAQETPA